MKKCQAKTVRKLIAKSACVNDGEILDTAEKKTYPYANMYINSNEAIECVEKDCNVAGGRERSQSHMPCASDESQSSYSGNDDADSVSGDDVLSPFGDMISLDGCIPIRERGVGGF